MRPNRMKQRIQDGESLVGAFVNVPHPELVEILGLSGIDFVIVDAEHTSLTPKLAEELIRAAELHDVTPVARVGRNDPQTIQKFLESGAQGVLIPLVNTGDDAQRVVDAVKYPPIGKRGLAPSRTSQWGLGEGGIGQHVEDANRETFIGVQIETHEAVDHFDDIANTDHVDLIFFGPSDLSTALGLPGQAQHPDVIRIIERLSQHAREAGKAVGTIAQNAEAAQRWRESGIQWLCTGTSGLFAKGVRSYLDDVHGAL